jgi:hypothetical protein
LTKISGSNAALTFSTSALGMGAPAYATARTEDVSKSASLPCWTRS